MSKEIANKIGVLLQTMKQVFAEAEPEGDAPAKVSAVLKDGTKVNVYGEIAEGSKIAIVAEDGSELPAPDGEHELEDGSIITVQDGAIVAVKAVEVEAEVESEYEKFKSEFESYLNAKIEELKKEFESKFAEQVKKEEDLKQQIEAFRSFSEQAVKVMEEIAGQPANEPINNQKNVFKKEDKLNSIVQTINALKTK